MQPGAPAGGRAGGAGRHPRGGADLVGPYGTLPVHVVALASASNVAYGPQQRAQDAAARGAALPRAAEIAHARDAQARLPRRQRRRATAVMLGPWLTPRVEHGRSARQQAVFAGDLAARIAGCGRCMLRAAYSTWLRRLRRMHRAPWGSWPAVERNGVVFSLAGGPLEFACCQPSTCNEPTAPTRSQLGQFQAWSLGNPQASSIRPSSGRRACNPHPWLPAGPAAGARAGCGSPGG
jgi:hypothetical protein